MIDHLVIGSGPAGVAVTQALLARGLRVTMLDGGKEVFRADQELQARLRSKAPEAWSAEERQLWQAPQFQTPPGQVRRYGSDAGMEPAKHLFDADSTPIGLRGSRATGGLSMLWGGAVRPYSARDMAGWPVSAEDMAPHYRAVADMVPISGPADNPLARNPTPEIGPQARRVLERAAESAHVTVHPASTAVASGCRACGMCLHGCPWELIWQAPSALAAFRDNPNFIYRAGAEVSAISETADGATVTLAEGETLSARHLYVATGVLETARLLMQMGWQESLTLRDSQFSFLPMLHSFAPGPVDKMPLTTLPKLFADIEPGDASPHMAHAQIYGWNEFYLPDLMASYGRGLPGARFGLNLLARRMMVAQVFLHSDHGARIGLRLGASGKLVAKPEPGADFEVVMAEAQARLAAHMRKAGLYALRFAARPAEPGASYHVGASLPMAATPTGAQADLLGRPAGLSHIHVVDASTLPAIPAATITLSVMANAHRIGSLVPE